MRLPDTTQANLAQRIASALHASGHQAFLVGGCVRDLLLGREPKDYDISTDALPSEVLRLFPGGRQVGAHFGVVLISEEDARVEVATFRSDHAYRDGRHPDRVQFESGARQDVIRRDFTVNALLLDPETLGVLDFTGGREDLAERRIRAIGDAATRFREDHLRMLRAVRFAASLGFTIEPETMTAISSLRALIREVSAERVRDELVRILTEGGARGGFELLDSSGLLVEVLPEVAALKGVPQPPEFHPEGDVWTHTLMMLEAMRNPGVTLALGVLLHDVGKPRTIRIEERIRFRGHAGLGADMAAGILARLRFSNEEIRRVEALVADHSKFQDVTRMRESTLRRFLRQPHFDEHLELHRLDCLASHGRMDNYAFVRDKLAALTAEQLKPRPLLTGRDLIEAGYRPGPAFHRVLEAVEDAQLEGSVATREAALDFVRSSFVKPDGAFRLAGT